MVRKSCFILGIALGIFWWIGLSENQGATLLWFDAVAAVLAFGTAALLSDPERNPEPRLRAGAASGWGWPSSGSAGWRPASPAGPAG